MRITYALAGFAAGLATDHLYRRWRRAEPRQGLDTLTRVPTRGAVHHALRRLRAGDAVVMVDLDGLKATNDAFGHGAGDEVLIALATHLSRGVRAGDLVARWGGDEFVVVVRAGGEAAFDVVERLRATSPAEFSAGVSVHGGSDGAATLAAADDALLRAKRAGGKRVVRA